MKGTTKGAFKKAISQLFRLIILPFLTVNLVLDFITKGTFSGFELGLLAVMCSVYLATHFVISQTKLR